MSTGNYSIVFEAKHSARLILEGIKANYGRAHYVMADAIVSEHLGDTGTAERTALVSLVYDMLDGAIVPQRILVRYCLDAIGAAADAEAMAPAIEVGEVSEADFLAECGADLELLIAYGRAAQ